MRVGHEAPPGELEREHERRHREIPAHLFLRAFIDVVAEVKRVAPVFRVPASVEELRDRLTRAKVGAP